MRPISGDRSFDPLHRILRYPSSFESSNRTFGRNQCAPSLATVVFTAPTECSATPQHSNLRIAAQTESPLAHLHPGPNHRQAEFPPPQESFPPDLRIECERSRFDDSRRSDFESSLSKHQNVPLGTNHATNRPSSRPPAFFLKLHNARTPALCPHVY